MKESTKAKISLYGWPTAYFALGIALAISVATAAYKTSFVKIFVSGQSMEPTLHGGSSGGAKEGDIVDFGYMDPSDQALANMTRFNIVTTYFPYKWSSADYDKEGKLLSTASYKIKRIIGFPNETITLSVDENKTCSIQVRKDDQYIQYTYDDNKKCWTDNLKKDHSFEIKHSTVSKETASKNYKTDLGPDEYFVLGDNWDVSSDSSINYYNTGIHLKRSNLQGVLIAIEGTAQVKYNSSTNKNEITNLDYHDKKYYYTEL